VVNSREIAVLKRVHIPPLLHSDHMRLCMCACLYMCTFIPCYYVLYCYINRCVDVIHTQTNTCRCELACRCACVFDCMCSCTCKRVCVLLYEYASVCVCARARARLCM